MAAVGVMCMIGFTIGSVALDIMGSGGGGQDSVVAKSQFGTIRQSDLDAMRMSRSMVREFLFQARVQAAAKQYGEQLVLRLAALLQSQLDQLIGPATESSVVETMILAEQARQMGIVIGDEAIVEFLRDFTLDQLSGDELTLIYKSLRSARGQPVNKTMLYDALRVEMLANRLRQMELRFDFTPGQRWQYYVRMKSRATVEVLPVATASFVDQVADPSESVLQDFFNTYKNQEPVPGSSDPGFKIPQLAALQYFEAEYEKFYDPAAITPEEVAEHYEKFKDEQFLFTDLGDLELSSEDKPGTEPGPPAEMPAEKPDGPAGEKPPPGGGGQKPAAGDAKSDTAETPEKSPQPPADVPKSAPKTPQEPNSDKPETGDTPKGAASTDEGADLKRPGDAPLGTDPAEVVDDRSDLENLLAQAGRTDTPGTGSAPGRSGSVPPAARRDSDATPDPTGEQGAATVTPAPPEFSRDWELPRDVREGPNPKYDPLWKVEPDIRKELAGKKAVERIEAVFRELRNQMQSYAFARSEKGADPPPLDFQSLAVKNGLIGKTTGLMSAHTASELEGIGGSTINNQNFVAFTFGNFKTFQTAQSLDSDGNRYLFWKTEDKEARVPEFSEVRAEVVRVWKLREARSLAVEKAEQLAQQARAQNKPLAEVFEGQPEMPVTETAPFSWLTTGTTGATNPNAIPRLSEVEGVQDAGEAFMAQVFSMQTGEVGVAMNNPQTIAYVIRVSNLDPAKVVLQEGFMVDPFDGYALASSDDRQQIYQEWLEKHKAEADLVWERQPEDTNLR